MMSNAKKAPNGSTWLRFAVFIVGGLETAAVLILLEIHSQQRPTRFGRSTEP